MRKILLVALVALTGCPQKSETPAASNGDTNAANTNANAAAPQTDEQKTLYALGLTLGRSIEVFNLKPGELDYVKAGLSAHFDGNPAVQISEYGPKVGALARSRSEERSKELSAKGVEFLAAAEKEPNAKKTESGLVYVPLKEGEGESPTEASRVKVHYKGTLVDGSEFDSSYSRNEPATFPLNGVIKCWTEGVQMMKPGGKARLVCPAEIAYGASGRPGIPPNSVLNFEVELLEVLAAPEAGVPPAPPTGRPESKPAAQPQAK